MNVYKQTVIKHTQLHTSCITNDAVATGYSKTLIAHAKLYTSCIASSTPIPEGPVLLEPIYGWTGYADCVLPPDLSSALLIDTLTGAYLISTGPGKNLIEA